MTNNTLQNTLIILFAGIACLLGYIVYTSNLPATVRPPAATGLPRSEADFRRKLTTLNLDKNKIEMAVKKLESSKQKSVKFLKEHGVKSGDDYDHIEDRRVKLAILNLQKDINAIKKSRQNIETYETAIANIRAMLDQIKRDRTSASAELTESQAIELEEIILDLDERLNVETDYWEDQELRDLLDAEMSESESN